MIFIELEEANLTLQLISCYINAHIDIYVFYTLEDKYDSILKWPLRPAVSMQVKLYCNQ